MHPFHRFTTLAAVAAVALAVPAAALAHPSVYSTTSLLNKTQEIQTITVDALAGTFKPSANATAVDFDATALEVQLALEKDPAIGTGNIAVTGVDGGPFTLKWVGAKIGTNEATVAPDAALLTGGASTATPALVTNGATAIAYVNGLEALTMPQQEFYVIAEHGYAPLLKETNGSNEGGMLNLKRLPGTYRGAPMTPADWLTFTPAQTDVQAHPVCEGVAALQSSANILAANEDPAQPFWNYVPFTKTSAGIADTDVTVWTDVLQTVLGGAYATTNTAAEFKTACETTLGGVYRPADAAGATSPIFSAALSDATTPLNSQITTLTGEKTALTSEKSVLTAANAALTTAKAALEAQLAKATEDAKRPLTFTAAGKRFSADDTHLLTGTAGAKATVTVSISSALAKSLGLKSTAIAMDKVTLDDAGAALVQPTVTRAAARKIGRRAATPVMITVVSGAEKVTAKATLIR